MSKSALNYLFLLMLIAIACTACTGADDGGAQTGPDGDDDSSAVADGDDSGEHSTGFKGGSTVGNPSEVEVRIVTRGGTEGGPDWGEISLGIHNIFLSSGVWNSTTFGEELIADSESDPRLELGERSSVRLLLTAPPEIEFSSLDLRLSRDAGAFRATGVFEGRRIEIECNLFGLLPFSALRQNYRWDANGRDSLIAVLDTDAMLSDDTLAELLAGGTGDIAVDLNHNEEFLGEINRSIIAAFRLYRDLNANGRLDADEQVEENLLSFGNSERAENWDQVWPEMSCENPESSGWEDHSKLNCNPELLGGRSAGDIVAFCSDRLLKYDGQAWRTVDYPEEYAAYAVSDIWKRGDGADVLATSKGMLTYKDGEWTSELQEVSFLQIAPAGENAAFALPRKSSDGIYIYNGGQWAYFCDMERFVNGYSAPENKEALSVGEPREIYMAASGVNDLWIMTTLYHHSLWHWDGLEWTEHEDIVREIDQIAENMTEHGPVMSSFIAPAENWLVFHYGYLVFEWKDGEIVVHNLLQSAGRPQTVAMAVSSADDMWAAGTLCSLDGDCSQNDTILLHYNGEEWRPMILPSKYYINAIWSSSADNVWFAAYSMDSGYGMFWHWDGSSLRPYQENDSRNSPTGDTVKLLWGDSPERMFIATAGTWDGHSRIFRLNSEGWRDVELPAIDLKDADGKYIYERDFHAAQSYGSCEAYFLLRQDANNGDYAVFHFDGAEMDMQHVFTVGNDKTPNADYMEITSIFVAASNDIWLAGSYDRADGSITGLLLHWDGVSVQSRLFDDGIRFHWLNGVDSSHIWASAPDEKNGRLYFWNGAEWKKQYIFPGWGSGLTAIYPFAADDVWGISASRVLHYNGHAWKVILKDLEVSSPQSLRGFGMDNLFIGGSRGGMLQWNGSEWKESKACTAASLTAILGMAGRELWIGGEYGTLLHYTED